MTDKRYKLKVTNYMVKEKGMKSCGDEFIILTKEYNFRKGILYKGLLTIQYY